MKFDDEHQFTGYNFIRGQTSNILLQKIHEKIGSQQRISEFLTNETWLFLKALKFPEKEQSIENLQKLYTTWVEEALFSNLQGKEIPRMISVKTVTTADRPENYFTYLPIGHLPLHNHYAPYSNSNENNGFGCNVEFCLRLDLLGGDFEYPIEENLPSYSEATEIRFVDFCIVF